MGFYGEGMKCQYLLVLVLVLVLVLTFACACCSYIGRIRGDQGDAIYVCRHCHSPRALSIRLACDVVRPLRGPTKAETEVTNGLLYP